MKRFLAWLLAALTALSVLPALAEGEVDVTGSGVTVLRNHLEGQTDGLSLAVDYPAFVCDDAGLQAFLEENVTRPFQALCGAQSDQTSSIRGGYCASLDFASLLSVEANVRYKEGDQTITVDRLVYSDNAPVSAENTVELVLEGEKKFEKNKTYYIGLCPLDGAGNWTFSETLYEFTYTEGQKPTADFSVIAYAVAAITGCGALVVAKKRG